MRSIFGSRATLPRPGCTRSRADLTGAKPPSPRQGTCFEGQGEPNRRKQERQADQRVIHMTSSERRRYPTKRVDMLR